MIKQIEKKYIDSALKDENGNVVVSYGEFSDVYENQVVKEPLPILGKIFPFLKRNVRKHVKTGKQDLILKKITVDNIRHMGESAPKILKDTLNKIPYRRIYKLDTKTYGDGLYLAHIEDQKYEILGKEGVVIGKFNMENCGYYSPNAELPFLPKETNNANGGACEPLSLQEILSNYCAKNQDCIEFIPKSTLQLFPNLKDEINEKSNTEKGNVLDIKHL